MKEGSGDSYVDPSLALDASARAFFAPVARMPHSRPVSVEVARKRNRGKGDTDGPVLDRVIRNTQKKNSIGTNLFPCFCILQDRHVLDFIQVA